MTYALTEVYQVLVMIVLIEPRPPLQPTFLYEKLRTGVRSHTYARIVEVRRGLRGSAVWIVVRTAHAPQRSLDFGARPTVGGQATVDVRQGRRRARQQPGCDLPGEDMRCPSLVLREPGLWMIGELQAPEVGTRCELHIEIEVSTRGRRITIALIALTRVNTSAGWTLTSWKSVINRRSVRPSGRWRWQYSSSSLVRTALPSSTPSTLRCGNLGRMSMIGHTSPARDSLT